MSLTFSEVTFGFRRRRAPVLEELTWSLPPGRTVLLGPNGAGKSTLLALGADACRPWRGSVGLSGSADTGRPRSSRGARAAHRRAVGWMPQQVHTVTGLRVREQVAYAGWLKGLSRAQAWIESGRALEHVELSDRANDRTSQLSGGQLRQVGVAQVLVHRPQVMLLDEPTVGLDPSQRARFRSVLTAEQIEVPVLVATHQVDDLSDVFDTVVVFTQGKIRWTGSVADFLALADSGAGTPQAETAYATLVSGEH